MEKQKLAAKLGEENAIEEDDKDNSLKKSRTAIIDIKTLVASSKLLQEKVKPPTEG